ncbi:MAG: hypothetical protein H7145_12085, partial [Akkermansiaceae bacterium]|nr:hypothetical protein [Armatimonadota bacterium]
ATRPGGYGVRIQRGRRSGRRYGGGLTVKTWDHPQWGQFRYSGGAWEGSVSAPGFDAFAHDTGYRNVDMAAGEYELGFEADGESDLPSEAAMAVAAGVIANPAALVSRITAALWDDFNGRGPDSGMWWHGDLDTVREGIEPAPEGPDDLPQLMRLNRVVILKTIEEYRKPVARLDFGAAFEEEHGVSILTDGQAILGAGNEIEVSPYASP